MISLKKLLIESQNTQPNWIIVFDPINTGKVTRIAAHIKKLGGRALDSFIIRSKDQSVLHAYMSRDQMQGLMDDWDTDPDLMVYPYAGNYIRLYGKPKK